MIFGIKQQVLQCFSCHFNLFITDLVRPQSCAGSYHVRWLWPVTCRRTADNYSLLRLNVSICILTLFTLGLMRLFRPLAMIMLICRAFSHPNQYNRQRPDHNTRTPCPTLCEKCVGSLTSPANQYREDAGDGAYGLLSLSEKTRTSNHLQMSLQRQHILLSYFKTLSVGPDWGSKPRPPARQSGALPTELSRRRSVAYLILITRGFVFLNNVCLLLYNNPCDSVLIFLLNTGI